jgi:hypothetical protein
MMWRKSFRAVLCVGVLGASSHAAVFSYDASMDGPSESPPNVSPATGYARVDYDDVAHTLRVQANFTGLLGTTTAAHIHSPTPTAMTGTAGVATQLPSFVGFPLGVNSGSMDQTFDLTQASSWNPSFVTNNGGSPSSAEAALALHLADGKAYFNVHSTSFPGGEIRGFFVLIPEPSMMALIGALTLPLLARRRRTSPCPSLDSASRGSGAEPCPASPAPRLELLP